MFRSSRRKKSCSLRARTADGCDGIDLVDDGYVISDEDDVDVKFPTKDELALLPPNIQEALMAIVAQSMKAALLPRIEFLLWRKRRKGEEAIVAMTTPRPPAAFLLSLAIFSKWSNVEEAAAIMTLRVLHPRQVLVFEHDRVSCVSILTSGTLHCRKKKASVTCKGYPDHATQLTRTIDTAPKCIHEKVFFTDAPARETIRAATLATVWTIDKRTYEDLLAKQAPEKQEAIRNACYAHRRELVEAIAPIGLEHLRALCVFKSVPDVLLAQLHSRLEARVYPAGHHLCRSGHACNEALVIARGTVRVTYKGSSVVLCTAGRGTVWGEVAALFVKPSAITVEALTICDVFVLSHSAMVSTLASVSYPSTMAEVLRAAHKIETEWEAEAKTQFLPFVNQIPFISALASTSGGALQMALLERFTSCVYATSATIMSASDACERVVIPVRGRARITSLNEDLVIGEAVGFTCLVPHRWKYHVAAHDPVQTLELSQELFHSILGQHGVLAAYEKLVRGLLFPLANPSFFAKALPLLIGCRNPPLFEPSYKQAITSLEPRVESGAGSLSLNRERKHLAPSSNSTIIKLADLRPPLTIIVDSEVEDWETERNRAQRQPPHRQKKGLSPSLRKLLAAQAHVTPGATRHTPCKDNLVTTPSLPLAVPCCGGTLSSVAAASQTDESFISEVLRKMAEITSAAQE